MPTVANTSETASAKPDIFILFLMSAFSNCCFLTFSKLRPIKERPQPSKPIFRNGEKNLIKPRLRSPYVKQPVPVQDSNAAIFAAWASFIAIPVARMARKIPREIASNLRILYTLLGEGIRLILRLDFYACQLSSRIIFTHWNFPISGSTIRIFNMHKSF